MGKNRKDLEPNSEGRGKRGGTAHALKHNGQVAVAYERESLDESIKHDYTTSHDGIVPLNRRRPLWHFAAMWFTLECGFYIIFLGFQLEQAGFTLATTALLTIIGCVIFIAYGMAAAYLGSRTGQTHSLLSRSVFGVTGSVIVSGLILISQTGWTGFQANLTAQMWDGLYGWGNILVIGMVLAGVMVINNVLGFTGVAGFARYIVTPLIFLWVIYLMIKGFTTVGTSVLFSTPKASTPITFGAAIGVVIGFVIWGAEPDIWRYGKPTFWWSLPAYVFGFSFGAVMFTLGGWIVARLSTNTAFGPSIREITHFSLFGAFWLAFIIITLNQFAVNDGNYYETINAGQNLVGGWRRWNRLYTCLIAAVGGVLAAWLIPYVFTNGFFKLASFGGISAPVATIIMATDHFVVPRLLGVSRPLNKVPSWSDTALVNWPGIVALLVGVGFGAYASGIIPGENPSTYWGIPPLEAWLLSAVVYVAGVAITQRVVPDVKHALGFSKHALATDVAPGTIVDVTNPPGREEAPVPGAAGVAVPQI